MEPEYWQQRWQKGETGFHLPRVHPKLEQYWPLLQAPNSAPVFVPLCGKSEDLFYLWQRGHYVTGIDISEQAIRAFFTEHQMTYQVERVQDFVVYQHDRLRLLAGDYFALQASLLGPIEAVYDRAALIALPTSLRQRYVQTLRKWLRPATSLLLITLDYAQPEMSGPPFAVGPDEVAQLFAGAEIEQLTHHDILEYEPRFRAKGVTQLHEDVYRIRC